MSNFFHSKDGAVAILTALIIPILVGFTALSIDTSLAFFHKERLQIAVDIGARAGAEILRHRGSEIVAITFAQNITVVNANSLNGTIPNVTVETPHPGRVEVSATLQVKTFFSKMFGREELTVFAKSIAVFPQEDSSENCLYVDEPRDQRALRLGRHSTLKLLGCEVNVASDHGRAVVLEPMSILQADCVNVSGGIAGVLQVKTVKCTSPMVETSVNPIDELLVDPPEPSGTCLNRNKSKAEPKKLEKFVEHVGSHVSGLKEYQACNGWEIVKDTSADPGLYFVYGDGLEIRNKASLTLAADSIIILEDEAEIEMDATASLSITSPKVGKFKSMAILAGASRKSSKKRKHQFGVVEIEGIILLREEELKFYGKSNTDKCSQIIAGRLELARDAKLSSNCKNSEKQEPGSVKILLDH